MCLLRPLLHVLSRIVKRYPRPVFIGTIAVPWVLFAFSGRAGSPWFPAFDHAIAVGVAGGIVAGVVQLGVRARQWPIVVGLYAAAINFGIAEFAYLFWNASRVRPGSFSEMLTKVDAAYYSMATFTTTGFGDVTASSQFARFSVTCEMALTFIAVAGGLAVLLSARRVPKQT